MSELTKMVIVDSESGEVTGYIGEGDRIIRKSSTESYVKQTDENYVYDFQKGKAFLKTYEDGMRKVRGELTNAECSFLWYLLPQMEYNTNLLRNDDGTLLNVKDLQVITGMSYDANRKLMEGLKDKGVIGKWETGNKDNPKVMFRCYVMNPFLFLKGNRVHKDLLEKFAESGWGE